MPILRSVYEILFMSGFQSLIDFKIKIGIRFDPEIADRFRSENRSAIFPERFSIAIVIAIAISKSWIDLKTDWQYNLKPL